MKYSAAMALNVQRRGETQGRKSRAPLEGGDILFGPRMRSPGKAGGAPVEDRDQSYGDGRTREFPQTNVVFNTIITKPLRYTSFLFALGTGFEMDTSEEPDIVSLDPQQPFWERVYMVSPLVVIGTQDADGAYSLAPKHMATPMGMENYFGFVGTPQLKTYHNTVEAGVFTVSYPRPSQIALASLAASPHVGKPEGPDHKPNLDQLPILSAKEIDGVFLKDAYLFLECELERKVDGLGKNSLLIGEVKAVHVHRDALRESEQDDHELIRDNPLLAYISPDRCTTIEETTAFPFPAGVRK